jgi:pimeloyl-ACP methyl ester carboxylesterase
MGHSLGGYIAGQFLKMFPKVVTSIFLLSPAGVNYPPKNSKKRLEEVAENQHFFMKYIFKDTIKTIFEEKVT